MTIIFEVKDKSGRSIYLSKERWIHINQEHPEVAPFMEDIKDAIVTPVRIIQYEYDKKVRYYYKYFKQQLLYLLVIVKYLNNHGFIVTAYFVRNIR